MLNKHRREIDALKKKEAAKKCHLAQKQGHIEDNRKQWAEHTVKLGSLKHQKLVYGSIEESKGLRGLVLGHLKIYAESHFLSELGGKEMEKASQLKT